MDALVALLDAPWYLSRIDGVVSEEVATRLREIALRKRAPEAAAELDRVKKVHATVLRAIGANLGLAPKPDHRIEGLRRRARIREASAMRLPK